MLPTRIKLSLEVATVLFAVVSAVATCASTYFAYKTIQIYHEQNARERRKEFTEMLSLAAGFLKGITEEARKGTSSCNGNQKQQEPIDNGQKK